MSYDCIKLQRKKSHQYSFMFSQLLRLIEFKNHVDKISLIHKNINRFTVYIHPVAINIKNVLLILLRQNLEFYGRNH